MREPTDPSLSSLSLLTESPAERQERGFAEWGSPFRRKWMLLGDAYQDVGCLTQRFGIHASVKQENESWLARGWFDPSGSWVGVTIMIRMHRNDDSEHATESSLTDHRKRSLPLEATRVFVGALP